LFKLALQLFQYDEVSIFLKEIDENIKQNDIKELTKCENLKYK